MSEHIEKMKEIGLKVKAVKATNSKVTQMIKKICEKDMKYFSIETDELCDRCIEICRVAEVDCEYMITLKEKYKGNNASILRYCCYSFLNACVA